MYELVECPSWTAAAIVTSLTEAELAAGVCVCVRECVCEPCDSKAADFAAKTTGRERERGAMSEPADRPNSSSYSPTSYCTQPRPLPSRAPSRPWAFNTEPQGGSDAILPSPHLAHE